MRIMKFFPAALAVLALASCSNDDLLGISTDNVQREAGKLYVQVEDLQDGMNEASTRAGFVYGTNDKGSANGQYFVWTKGDTVKIYDDNQNWRTQIWEFDAAATQAYKKADGFSVFSKIKQIAGVKADEAPTQYTNAYGVTPAAIGKFANEDRTALEFNLSSLAYWEADRAAVTDVYTDGMLSKAPIPMWGVATSTDGSSEMKVKYLTGILKVDIAQLPKTADNTVNVLVIQSKVGDKMMDLHPASVTAAFAPESTDKAPELQVEATTTAATTLNNSETSWNNEGENVPADIMVINLGEIAAANAGKRCCVVVPIPVAVSGTPAVAQEQEIAAYLGTAAKATPKNVTIDPSKPVAGAAIKKTVASGKYYLIQDEGAYALDGVNTLNLLEEKIKALDAASDRDFTITLNENITVKNGNDEDGYVLDLSDYKLKNNVTMEFKSTKSFIKAAEGGDLEIRTMAGSKTLTYTHATQSGAVDKIIATAKMAGPVVVNGEALTTIEAGSANLTIGCAVTTVNATAETNIDADTKAITTLNINKGCEKVNVLNGTVAAAAFGAYDAKPADNKQIDADVEIHTEGNGQITAINYTNVPKTNVAASEFTKQVIWTSKWDGASKTNVATKITGIAASAVDAIVSASQLANGTNNYSAAARILAKEIDLDGKTWTSLSALTKGIDGNISVVPTSSTKVLAVVNTQIKNLAGTNGLIAKWTPAAASDVIKNITFSGANIAQTAANNNIGLLVGEVDNQTAAGTIQDIQLTGTNNILGKSGKSVTSIGAVIGKISDATNALTLANIQVASGTNVTGSKYVGGIVGEIAGKVKFAAKGATSKTDATIILKSNTSAAVVAGDVFNKSAATVTTYKVGNSQYAPNLATKGQLFGGASAVAADGDITIVGGITDQVSTDAASWAYYIPTTEGEYNPWQITNNYAEIGACGFTAGTNDVTEASGFNAIYMLTSNGDANNPIYAKQTSLVPYVGTAIQYADAVKKNTYGLGKTLYFSYVTKP